MSKFWLIPCLAVGLTIGGGCGSDKPDRVILCTYADAVAALNDVKFDLVRKFCEYDTELNYASYRLTGKNLAGPEAKRLAASLQQLDGFVRAAGILDRNGKRCCHYPADYFAVTAEAKEIPDAAAVMSRLCRDAKVLSAVHLNRNRELVADYLCPIKNGDGAVTGAVYLRLAVTELCRYYVGRAVVDMPVNIWVMQTDGLIVYDADPDEINRNIIAGDYFRAYPGLIRLAGRVAAAETGTGQYSYLSKGNKVELVKSAQWDSFTAGGRQWRIVMNIEDRLFIR
ncbi:MAG: hypothetical protein PHQ27_08835 [Victivallales bacterium]|nr:hypothetical protein [Victivallales bacterium]